MSQAHAAAPAIEPVSFNQFSRDFDGFAQRLGGSFARYGFAVISDHGIPQDRIDAAVAAGKAFFALPEDEKRKYKLPVGGQRGYTPFGIETAKGAEHYDLKEFWHVGRDLPPGHRFRSHMPDNVWPDADVPGFHETVGWLYDALDQMGLKVLEAIAAYLGLEPRFFESTVDFGNSILRLLHYPPVPKDGPHIRAGAHEDINVITLLLGAEEAGLEVLDRDGRWLAINPPPGALVCNIGDMLQRLTNHRLPSTTHRVVNPAPERRGFPRYSTPFFLHFNSDYEIRTLPNCVDAEHPDRYPQPITADEYLQERLREIKLA
ncbi:isopenicillin N synthase family oxygenase [Phenylobacterium hankyongense]|uniref:2-oxoglutarate-dependent ethylene/succinate-forming enzyme n=1 Tax=Phenylobacterium hankyongense TaxID=1813876 RepID=A0A328AXG5_9CAUL|nr:2-oxoglutarate and iron-dependent oxygenase domain-containing protein [Phenylobacterium hankyongense]RAK59812.1 isopenicillin N synthase family oxygenase [Phenylobacterium hankyongense]